MRKKYLIGVVLFYLGGHIGSAQSDPHYSQYMFNMNVVNPAYAGSKEGLTLTSLYRRQWTGLEGSPTTITFSGHSPVGNNVGLGISFISDEIGPVTEKNTFLDFSYTLKLNNKHRLAFGVKVGATFHNAGLFSDIAFTLPNTTDPAFSENIDNTYFNFGSGIFYHTDKYYVGLSVPNFLNANHLDFNDMQYGKEVSHFFLNGGYVFDINEKLLLKPSFMAKSAFGVRSSLDISTNVLINNKLEFGVSYRLEDSFGALVNFAVGPNINVGYAYDHVVSDLNYATPNSHEVILIFDIRFNKNVSRSPQFF